MRKAALALAVSIGCGSAEKPATVRVPALYGPDIDLPVSKLGQITPLGWAMMLDRDDGTVRERATRTLFERLCQQRLDLADRVGRLQAARAKFASARRQAEK